MPDALTIAARRKLLGILPRSTLEELSGLERPWAVKRAELIHLCITRWDHDEVESAVRRILDRAWEIPPPPRIG